MAAFPEVTNCKLTISCPKSIDSALLYQFLTKDLGFKILGFNPLVVEKDSPTESDLCRLFRELDTRPKLEQAASCDEFCNSLQEKVFIDQGSFKTDAKLDSNQDEEEELERLINSFADWEIVGPKVNENHEENKSIGLIDAHSSATLKYFPSEDNRAVATSEINNLKASKLNDSCVLYRKSSFDNPCREEQELKSVKAEQTELSVQLRQDKTPADIEKTLSMDNKSEGSGHDQRLRPKRQLSEESKRSTNNEGNNIDLSEKRKEDNVRSQASITSEVSIVKDIYPYGTSHSLEHALQKNSFSGDGREFSSKVAMKINDEQSTKQSEVNNTNINLVENLPQDDETLEKANSYHEDVVPLAKTFTKEPYCTTSTSPRINSKHDEPCYMTHTLEKPRDLSADDIAGSVISAGSKKQERNKKNSLYPNLENALQDKEKNNTTDGNSAEVMLSVCRKESHDQKGSNVFQTSQMSSYEENNGTGKLRGHESSSRINTVSSLGRETNPLFGCQPESMGGEHSGSSDYHVTSSDPRITCSPEMREISGMELDIATTSRHVLPFGRDNTCDGHPVSRPGEHPGSSYGFHATLFDHRASSLGTREMYGKEQETTPPSNIVSSSSRDFPLESLPVPRSVGSVGSHHGHHDTSSDFRLKSSSESRGVTGKEQEANSPSNNVSPSGRDVGSAGSHHGHHGTSSDFRLTSSLENRRVTGNEQETNSPSNNVSSSGRDFSPESQPVPRSRESAGSHHDYHGTSSDFRLTSSSESRGVTGKEQETNSPNNNASYLGKDASQENRGQYPTGSQEYQVTSVDPEATAMGIRGGTGFIGSRNNNHFTVRGVKGLQVHVLRASITTLPVDCIVNAANRRLKHADGIAKIIAEAAGYRLVKECEDFTKYGDTVEVTHLFVSTGGSLPAKFVMHAVGPKWDDYADKWLCEEHLRHTILRCLAEASRLGCRSIAIPSISAAKAKVPKELCAKCYIQAAKIFEIVKEVFSSPLHEIYFVDVSDSMVHTISRVYQTIWHNLLPDWQVTQDMIFVENHFSLAERKEEEALKKKSNKFFKGSPSLSQDWKNFKSGQNNASSKTSEKPLFSAVASPGATKQSQLGALVTTKSHNFSASIHTKKTASFRTAKKSATEVNYEFENITLTVSSRRAFDHHPNLTLTVGSFFDELSSLASFKVSDNYKKNKELPEMKNHFNFVNISKPGSSRSLLVCRLFPDPSSVEQIKEAFKTLEQHYTTMFSSISRDKTLVITSCLLYKDSKYKLLPTFAQCLIHCLKLLKKLSFKNIIVTGSEDALPVLMKVLESGNLKRIKPEGDDSDEYDSPKSSHKEEREEGQTRPEIRSRLAVKETEDLGTSVDSDNVCQICAIKPPFKETPCCHQKLCGRCEAKLSTCPWCKKHWKIQLGDQPNGFMTVSVSNEDAAGYDKCGSYKIEYFIPHGIQQKHHPMPGARFDSLNRTAYIPMTKQGFQVLLLLRLAFIRKLTFTIGQSMTTSRSGTLIWNDIHHKTSLRGSAHGYPDSSYLDRVTMELSNKGVTIDSATDEESKELDKFSNCVQGKDSFSDLDQQ